MDATRDADRTRRLFELGSAFAARLELDELLPLVVTSCPEALDAEGASVLLLDASGEQLYFPHVAADDPGVAAKLTAVRVPRDQGIAGAVLREQKTLHVTDAQSDGRLNAEVDRLTGFTTRALIATPLRGRGGTIGVLQVVNPHHGGFTDDDVGFLETLGGAVAMAIENARLYDVVRASEERLRGQVGVLRRDLARLDEGRAMVGTSPAMDEVRRLMQSAATSPVSVLIEGETGTGKELVARGIHAASDRADGPFVAVNCAALAETLLESELFGHKKGSFTGAMQDRRGLFEVASGGTIFLDEVGEMPLPMQAKLLRVLQESEVTPIGEHRPRKIDVRVVAATNRDLEEEIAAKRFRDDLFYRLAVFPIVVPPLRERGEDVPLLAQRFVESAAATHKKQIDGIQRGALDLLQAFRWPGNVRELQNEIERSVALAKEGDALTPAHLSRKLTGGSAAPPAAAPVGDESGQPLREAREAFEIRYVSEMLARHEGNVSHTAKALGISRVMLQKKMKQFGLRDDG